jgi:hypothetical protein
MNIHLPAILMFTRGTIGFDTLPCGKSMKMGRPKIAQLRA